MSDAPTDAPLDEDADEDAAPPRRPWYRRIGPGLVTACVVIGPGSLMASSKVGAVHGYGMSWVVLVVVGCMMVYTTLGAKLGALGDGSPADLVTRHAGRPLAAFVGLAIFFVATTFQYGNNLGVDAALQVYTTHVPTRIGALVAFNGLCLAFLFAFRNLYNALEKLMSVFVAAMLLAFLANLIFSAPPPGKLLGGFVPGLGARFSITVEVLALVATTFSAAAAYYQAYLVRQRGWGRGDLRDGLLDARVATGVMGAITLMLVWTAGTVLYGQMTPKAIEDATPMVIANQLAPLFGPAGVALFCTGLFCAAYSSFLVNSMIGGFVLADGLGLGHEPSRPVPRILTAISLVIGLGIAIGVIQSGAKPVSAIVAAQAVTVVVSPLMAGVLLWLTNRRDVVGDEVNGPWLNAAAVFGFVLLLGMAARQAMKVAASLGG